MVNYTYDDSGERVISYSVNANIDFATDMLMDEKETWSKLKWIRLPNGDLILGRYPLGDTYEKISQKIKM